MSSLKEELERAEMTAHISSKQVGLKIALIGVLIAFCAAMVSSEQNVDGEVLTTVRAVETDVHALTFLFHSQLSIGVVERNHALNVSG
jgi:hypothetical protein